MTDNSSELLKDDITRICQTLYEKVKIKTPFHNSVQAEISKFDLPPTYVPSGVREPKTTPG